MNALKQRSLAKPLVVSLLVHTALLTFLFIFPPTKAIFLQKAHKTVSELTVDTPEKILDEITVVRIPKKTPSDQIGELLGDEVGAIELDDDFIPHIDIAREMTPSTELEMTIDASSSMVFSDLEKIEQPLESYLSPLSNPVPDELLAEAETPQSSWEPKEPLIEQDAPTPQIAELDEFHFPSYSKELPNILQTELYTYTDQGKDQYFKMELKLQDHKLLEEESGEYLFVIDCTQKNAKQNYGLYKEAILKSIKSLKNSDRFNIVYLNKEMSSLFENAENYSLKKHLILEEMLENHPKFEGRFKDLVKNLGKLFDKTEETSLHTHVILFTEEPKKDPESLIHLSKYAHSRLSVYPVLCAEDGKKAKTLRTFVEKMGGRVLASPTRASFTRKFTGLLLDIKKIRLRNVSIKLEGDEGPLEVSFSEKSKELTLKKPLKIFGKMLHTKHLKLQVTGTHGEDLYEMNKVIPVVAAKKGSSLIKEELEKTEE